MLAATIFDVDGVLLASPHERAWREALAGYADPARFTTAMYQAEVAGKPREDGALAALMAIGVPEAAKRAGEYAARKQARLEALIAEGRVEAFPDALRLVLALDAAGWPMAVASSSRNASAMLRAVVLPDGRDLLGLFAADLCGREMAHGKPAPDLFLLAAEALGMEPAHCLVVEDAPAGVEAARAGGMAALGVARLEDAALLRAADRVVESLDEVDVPALLGGRLRVKGPA
ncbi:HAD family phosphatase [Acetobacteraceae bacterium H6797]|nr:HAD family phosphatase [Acetobacteraceae bacterium H6797]